MRSKTIPAILRAPVSMRPGARTVARPTPRQGDSERNRLLSPSMPSRGSMYDSILSSIRSPWSGTLTGQSLEGPGPHNADFLSADTAKQTNSNRYTKRLMLAFKVEMGILGKWWDTIDMLLNLAMCVLYVRNTTWTHPGNTKSSDICVWEYLKLENNDRVTDFNFGIPCDNLLVDAVLSVLALLVFMPHYYLSADRRGFALSLYSVVTLMSTLPPIWILFENMLIPGIRKEFMSAGPNEVLFYPLRFYRLNLSLQKLLVPTTRRFNLSKIVIHGTKVVGTVATVVLALTALTHIVLFKEFKIDISKGDLVSAKLKQFGDAFFFTAVSSVTGISSDVVPKSLYTRGVVIVILFLSLFWLPPHMSEMLVLWNEREKWPRKHTPQRHQRHVILLGDFTYDSLAEFLREFYCNDHGSSTITTTVVLLSEKSPTREICELLEYPEYAGRVKYCIGSPTRTKDLKNLNAQAAEAIFLFSSTKSLPVDVEQDNASKLVTLLVLDRFLTKKGSKTKILVQINLPGTASQLKNFCHEVICTETLRLGLLAQSTMIPGSTSLIQLLTTSFSRQSYQHLTKKLEREIRKKHDKSQARNELQWMFEYIEGMGQEIYEVRIPEGVTGKFEEVACMIYQKYEAIMFALICVYDGLPRAAAKSPSVHRPTGDSPCVTTPIGTGGGHKPQVVVNPIGYHIKGGETAFVIASESEIKDRLATMTMDYCLDMDGVYEHEQAEMADIIRNSAHDTGSTSESNDEDEDEDENSSREGNGKHNERGMGNSQDGKIGTASLKSNEPYKGDTNVCTDDKNCRSHHEQADGDKHGDSSRVRETSAGGHHNKDSDEEVSCSSVLGLASRVYRGLSPSQGGSNIEGNNIEGSNIESAGGQTSHSATTSQVDGTGSESGDIATPSPLLSTMSLVDTQTLPALTRSDGRIGKLLRLSFKGSNSQERYGHSKVSLSRVFSTASAPTNITHLLDIKEPPERLVPSIRIPARPDANGNSAKAGDGETSNDKGAEAATSQTGNGTKFEGSQADPEISTRPVLVFHDKILVQPKARDGRAPNIRHHRRRAHLKEKLSAKARLAHNKWLAAKRGRNRDPEQKVESVELETTAEDGKDKVAEFNSEAHHAKLASSKKSINLDDKKNKGNDNASDPYEGNPLKKKFSTLPENLSKHLVICVTGKVFPKNLEYLIGCIRMSYSPKSNRKAKASKKKANRAERDSGYEGDDYEGHNGSGNDASAKASSDAEDLNGSGSGTNSGSGGERDLGGELDSPVEGTTYLSMIASVFKRSYSAHENQASQEAKKSGNDGENKKLFVNGTINTKRLLPNNVPVVVLCQKWPSQEQLDMFDLLGGVYIVQGSPTLRIDLIRAKIQVASNAIVLSSRSDGHSKEDEEEESGAGSRSDEEDDDYAVATRESKHNRSDIANADAVSVLVTMHIEELTQKNARFRHCVEMNHRENMPLMGLGNIYYFEDDPAEMFLNYGFMSGAVYAPIMLDTMICQAHYNEHLTTIIHSLLFPYGDISALFEYGKLIQSLKRLPKGSGSDGPGGDSANDINTIVDNIIDPLKSKPGPISHLFLVDVPQRFVGKSYGKLLMTCCYQYEAIPLGLYRFVKYSDENVWYVVPNPNKSLILGVYDKVYLLAHTRPQLK